MQYLWFFFYLCTRLRISWKRKIQVFKNYNQKARRFNKIYAHHLGSYIRQFMQSFFFMTNGSPERVKIEDCLKWSTKNMTGFYNYNYIHFFFTRSLHEVLVSGKIYFWKCLFAFFFILMLTVIFVVSPITLLKLVFFPTVKAAKNCFDLTVFLRNEIFILLFISSYV